MTNILVGRAGQMILVSQERKCESREEMRLAKVLELNFELQHVDAKSNSPRCLVSNTCGLSEEE